MLALLLLVLHQVFSSEVRNPLSAILLKSGVVQDTVYQPVWPLLGVQYHIHEQSFNNTGRAASVTATPNSKYLREIQQHIGSIGNGLLLFKKQISVEWNQTAVYNIFNTCEQRLNDLKSLDLQNLPQRIQIKVEHLEQSVENIKTTILSIVESEAQGVETSSTPQLFEQWEITLENIIMVIGSHSNKLTEEDRLKLAKISIQVLSILETVELYDIRSIVTDKLNKIKLIHDVIKDYEKYNIFSVKKLINVTTDAENNTYNNVTDLKYRDPFQNLRSLVNSLNEYLNKSRKNYKFNPLELNNHTNLLLEEVKRLGEENIPPSLREQISTLQRKVKDFQNRTTQSNSVNMDLKETHQREDRWEEFEDLVRGLEQYLINFDKYLPSEISIGGLNKESGQVLPESNSSEKHIIPKTLAKLIVKLEKNFEPFKNKKDVLDISKMERNQTKPHRNKQPLEKLEDLAHNLELVLINLEEHSEGELKNITEQLLAEVSRVGEQNIPTTLLEIIQILQKRVENFINKPSSPNTVDREINKTTTDMRNENITNLQYLLLSFQHYLITHNESDLVRCKGYRVPELKNKLKELLAELKNMGNHQTPTILIQVMQNLQTKLEECREFLTNKEIQNNITPMSLEESYIVNPTESEDFITNLTDMLKFLENYLYHLEGHEKLKVYEFDILELNKNVSEELSKLRELNITTKLYNRITVLKERVDNFINLSHHLIQLQDVLNRLTRYIMYVHGDGSLAHLSIIIEEILEHLIYLREYNIIPKTLLYSVLNLQKKVKYIQNSVAQRLPHEEATDNVQYTSFEINQRTSKQTYNQFKMLQRSVKILEKYMKHLDEQGYSGVSQIHLLELKTKINTLLIELKKIGELNISTKLFKSILALQRQLLSFDKKISVFSASNINSRKCMTTNQNKEKCTQTLQSLINTFKNDLMIMELNVLDLKSKSENVLADLRRFGVNRLPINLVRMIITQHKTIEQLNTIMQLYSKHDLHNEIKVL